MQFAKLHYILQGKFPICHVQFAKLHYILQGKFPICHMQFAKLHYIPALFCRANFQFATCKIAPHPALFCRAKFQFARAICKIALQSRPYFAGQISNLPHAKLHHILPYFVGQSFNLPVQFAKLHYRAGLILQGKFSICPMLPLHPPYICFRMKNSSSNPMHPSLFTSATRLISAASAKPASIFRHP